MSAPVILVAEPEQASREARALGLQSVGFKVVQAGTGLEALTVSAERQLDAAVLHLDLRDPDGLEVCRRLRAAGGRIAIVHLRGPGGPEQEIASLEGAGADCCLPEATEGRILAAHLRAILRNAPAGGVAPLQALWYHHTAGFAIADCEAVHNGNGAFLQMSGYSAAEILAAPVDWRRLLTAESCECCQRALAQALAEGWCDPFDSELLARDGRRTPVIMAAQRMDGGVPRCVTFVLDRTAERRRLEKQRRESMAVLAGGIAHDFNNLLTGILGNASLVSETVAAGTAEHRLVSEMIWASQSAADLTRQILAYCGMGRAAVRPLKISQFLRARRSRLEAVLPRNVGLEYELAEDLPQMEADPGQLQQVIYNLVMNAAEAIGERPGTIQIAAGQVMLEEAVARRDFGGEIAAGPYVWIQVRDDGCGMDEATRDRIFEPFFSTKFLGRGMGLAAVAGIVRAHAGGVTVTSAPGEGARFRVYLPVRAGRGCQI